MGHGGDRVWVQVLGEGVLLAWASGDEFLAIFWERVKHTQL